MPWARRSGASALVSLFAVIRYIRSVLRFLLFLLLSMLLTGADRDVGEVLVEQVAQWREASGGDCCPASSDQSEDAEDCCDDDFGMCSIVSVAVLPPASRLAQQVRVVLLAEERLSPPGLLHPRATGPPRFRPPIA